MLNYLFIYCSIINDQKINFIHNYYFIYVFVIYEIYQYIETKKQIK